MTFSPIAVAWYQAQEAGTRSGLYDEDIGRATGQALPKHHVQCFGRTAPIKSHRPSASVRALRPAAAGRGLLSLQRSSLIVR